MNTSGKVPLLTPVALRDALRPVLKNLEVERRRAFHRVVLCVIPCVAATVFGYGLMFFYLARIEWLRLLWTACVIAVSTCSNVIFKATRDYREQFKTLVLPTLMKAFGDFHYAPRDAAAEADLRKCRLFANPAFFLGENMLQGRIGATALRVAEVRATKLMATTMSQRNSKLAFRSLLVIADFNKSFTGSTLVYTDFLRDKIGVSGNGAINPNWKIALADRQEVHLEDPEFAREFVVYADDQVEARYVLSPALMQRLVALKKRLVWLHVGFVEGKLYLALPTEHAFLEPPPLSRPLVFAELSGSLEQLSLVVGLVRDLDLNTRVWNRAAPSRMAARSTPPLS